MHRTHTPPRNHRTTRSILQGTFLLASLLAPATLRAQGPPPCPPPNAHIDIESGSYSPQPNVTFRLRRFTGTLTPQGRTAPLCYLKQTLLTHAEIDVTDASLTETFASKLKTSGSKIKNFKVTNTPGEVKLSGKITKLIPIDFSVIGTVTTDGNVLMLHARKIDADGIPVKALLGAIGQHLSSVLSMKGVGGIVVKDNNIIFSVEKIAHLRGHIQSVDSTDGGLRLVYNGPATPRHGAADPTDTPSPATPADTDTDTTHPKAKEKH